MLYLERLVVLEVGLLLDHLGDGGLPPLLATALLVLHSPLSAVR